VADVRVPGAFLCKVARAYPEAIKTSSTWIFVSGFGRMHFSPFLWQESTFQFLHEP
jgi:hypothetical protein